MRRTFLIIGIIFGIPAMLLLAMAAFGPPKWFGPDMAKASVEAEVALHIGYVVGTITWLAIGVAIAAIMAQRQTARANATLTHLTNMELDNDFLEAKLEFLELVSSNEIMQYAGKESVHTDKAQKIRVYLNHFEMISLGIQHGIIDYEIFKKWNKSTVLLVWAKACPFVMELRKQFHNSELFVEFEGLRKISAAIDAGDSVSTHVFGIKQGSTRPPRRVFLCPKARSGGPFSLEAPWLKAMSSAQPNLSCGLLARNLRTISVSLSET